jgi:two-component system chemotaxis response regulator CheB
MKRPTSPLVEAARPILVIDDSAVVRQALRAIIEEDPGFQALTANDPYQAVDVMRRTAPAAIVLDVDMPKMDGLTFLRKLMRQHPLPVLLCTDHPERGVAGLELGALEVISKPRWGDPEELVGWGERLRESLRLAIAGRSAQGPAGEPAAARETGSRGTQRRHSADVILPRSPHLSRGASVERIIAIGASTGGVQAIPRLLTGLSGDLPGIVIVQHMPGGFTAAFASRLAGDPKIQVRVSEAQQGEWVRPGSALVIPGGVHGVIRRSGAGHRVELVDGPAVSRHRPSVDVLFRSTAQAAGPRALGVILTGMLDDGAEGMAELHEDGAWTIAQDEATCTVFGMPGAAIRRGGVRQVLPLDRIAAAIAAWAADNR